MEKIRSFIAISLPQEIKNKITETQKSLMETKADVRWVNIDGIHLTLKFLADIERSQVKEILSAIKAASEGIKPFSLEIASVGAFPKIEYPRVVWIGINDETNTLKPIQKKIDENLSKIGFDREERDFKPHLTLGRVKSLKGKERLIPLILQAKDLSLGRFEVTEVLLMQSVLKPTGAEYSEIGKIELLFNGK